MTSTTLLRRGEVEVIQAQGTDTLCPHCNALRAHRVEECMNLLTERERTVTIWIVEESDSDDPLRAVFAQNLANDKLARELTK